MINRNFQVAAFSDEAGADLTSQIAALTENGLTGPELRGVDGRNVTDLTVGEAKEIKRRLDNAGLTVRAIGSPIGKINIRTDDFRVHTDLFLYTLELAGIFQADCIRMFSFYIPADMSADDCTGEVIDRIGGWLSAAREYGVTLCHENEKGIYGDTAERCHTLLTALPDLAAVFDPANFVQCGVETIPAYELLRGRINYFHVKDAMQNGCIVPAGAGAGHLSELLRAYRADGGRYLTLEPHLADFVGLLSLENNGERSRVGEAFRYSSAREAFDAAVTALDRIMED